MHVFSIIKKFTIKRPGGKTAGGRGEFFVLYDPLVAVIIFFRFFFPRNFSSFSDHDSAADPPPAAAVRFSIG